MNKNTYIARILDSSRLMTNCSAAMGIVMHTFSFKTQNIQSKSSNGTTRSSQKDHLPFGPILYNYNWKLNNQMQISGQNWLKIRWT